MKHTYPIVSTHWVEGIGTTDKNHLIISWNKYFDEVVALILKEKQLHDCQTFPTPMLWWQAYKEGAWQAPILGTHFMLAFHSTIFSILLSGPPCQLLD